MAFDKEAARGLEKELDRTLQEMSEEGTIKQIVGKYLPDAERYMGGAYEK